MGRFNVYHYRSFIFILNEKRIYNLNKKQLYHILCVNIIVYGWLYNKKNELIFGDLRENNE